MVKSQYKKVFDRLKEIFNFSDLDKPFYVNTSVKMKRDEFSLSDPDSKAVYLILWFYTIEPPLYAILNQACRENN